MDQISRIESMKYREKNQMLGYKNQKQVKPRYYKNVMTNLATIYSLIGANLLIILN